MILILPLFLMLVFTIMELGHLAFQTLLLNHAAFELARIGSLSAAPQPNEGFSPNMSRARNMMNGNLSKMYPRRNTRLTERVEVTLRDPQSKLNSSDLVVSLEHDCPLVFPMTHILLSNTNQKGFVMNRRSRTRMLSAEVRMPIQQPAFQ